MVLIFFAGSASHPSARGLQQQLLRLAPEVAALAQCRRVHNRRASLTKSSESLIMGRLRAFTCLLVAALKNNDGTIPGIFWPLFVGILSYFPVLPCFIPCTHGGTHIVRCAVLAFRGWLSVLLRGPRISLRQRGDGSSSQRRRAAVSGVITVSRSDDDDPSRPVISHFFTVYSRRKHAFTITYKTNLAKDSRTYTRIDFVGLVVGRRERGENEKWHG